jgi:hypothetical protein
MVKRLVIYLDTSVLNFLFAEDAPEKRDITLEFFEGVSQGKYEVYISDAVIADVLLSWNFKHLANINKERLVRALCLMEGYSDRIEMRGPMGVIGDE